MLKKYLILTVFSALLLAGFVAAPSQDRRDYTTNHNFSVEIDGVLVGGFKEVDTSIIFSPNGNAQIGGLNGKIGGHDSPSLEFTQGEPYHLNAELFFDTFEDKKDVRGFTSILENAVQFNKDVVNQPPGRVERPSCIATIDASTFRCEVEEVQTTYTMFLPDGTPVRATVNLTLHSLPSGLNGSREQKVIQH